MSQPSGMVPSTPRATFSALPAVCTSAQITPSQLLPHLPFLKPSAHLPPLFSVTSGARRVLEVPIPTPEEVDGHR